MPDVYVSLSHPEALHLPMNDYQLLLIVIVALRVKTTLLFCDSIFIDYNPHLFKGLYSFANTKHN